MKVMEGAGKPTADGLGISLHLVDMLPTILLQITFNIATQGITSFALEVYAALPKSRTDLLDFSYVPALKSEQYVMSVLHEEIAKDTHGMTEEKTVPPTWLMSVAPMASISVKAVETDGGDGLTCSLHTSRSPTQQASGALVPHSPSKSPSLGHCS